MRFFRKRKSPSQNAGTGTCYPAVPPCLAYHTPTRLSRFLRSLLRLTYSASAFQLALQGPFPLTVPLPLTTRQLSAISTIRSTYAFSTVYNSISYFTQFGKSFFRGCVVFLQGERRNFLRKSLSSPEDLRSNSSLHTPHLFKKLWKRGDFWFFCINQTLSDSTGEIHTHLTADPTPWLPPRHTCLKGAGTVR